MPILTIYLIVSLHRIHFTTLNTPGKKLEGKQECFSLKQASYAFLSLPFRLCSHVTMSANKLLNRIVIPENVDYERETGDIAEDLHDYT
jgi:hypothetical protein